MSGATFPKTWSDGETLTHTDLNGNFSAVNEAVGAASGIASLNSSSLAVEDPANATATKSAGKICKWGASEAFQCSALTATTVAGTTGNFSGQVTSTVATGTAPFVIASTTEVANLKSATSTLATSATSINVTTLGANGTSGTQTRDLGTVTDGDIILVSSEGRGSMASAGTINLAIAKDSGTATIQTYNGQSQLLTSFYTAETGVNRNYALTGIVEVTGSGTLVIVSTFSGGTLTVATNHVRADFLKKQ